MNHLQDKYDDGILISIETLISRAIIKYQSLVERNIIKTRTLYLALATRKGSGNSKTLLEEWRKIKRNRNR